MSWLVFQTLDTTLFVYTSRSPVTVLQLVVLVYTLWYLRIISHIEIRTHCVFRTGYKETQEFVDNVRGGDAGNVSWKAENQTSVISTK